MVQLEAQLKQSGRLAGSPEASAELQSLLERMNRMQRQSEQGRESLQATLNQMQQLQEQCEKLQTGVEMLMQRSSDIQVSPSPWTAPARDR
ncbi:Exodeoxyribonuclease 7 small subunit [Varanus komodoensis]|nr:Exodeoxyribonuclease 7 small subunit [Varanus komodoensis]